MLVEIVVDRLNALTLKNCPVTVHAEGGLIGMVVRTSIVSGQVVVRTNNNVVALPGRKVADLDTFIEKKA